MPLFTTRDLGRGWQTVPMWNNAERLDAHGDDDHSAAVRAARLARVLTALDEGAAFRQRRDKVLAVVRVEIFADADDRVHRAAWTDHGLGCLDAVWRQRWRERGVTPGWIESRWKTDQAISAVAPADDDASAAVAQFDWITVEDQTATAQTQAVERYEHLTVWCGRATATITVRHDDVLDLDGVTMAAGLAAYRRLWQLDR